MNVIYFIKRNISIFNFFAVLIFIFSVFNLIILKGENDYHGMATVVLYGFLLISLILLLVDYFLRKIIIDTSTLAIVQIILLVVMLLFIAKLFS